MINRMTSALLETWYERWADRLFAVACSLLTHPSDAEDAVHDVFINLMGINLPEDEAAYLFTALRHAVARRWRDRQRRRQVDVSTLEDVPQSPHEPPDADVELTAALNTLTLEQRLVLSLKIDAGLTFAQVASACGINANTAASRYRYALEHLRDRLRARERS